MLCSAGSWKSNSSLLTRNKHLRLKESWGHRIFSNVQAIFILHIMKFWSFGELNCLTLTTILICLRWMRWSLWISSFLLWVWMVLGLCLVENLFSILYNCSIFIELHWNFAALITFLHTNKWQSHTQFNASAMEIFTLFTCLSLIYLCKYFSILAVAFLKVCRKMIFWKRANLFWVILACLMVERKNFYGLANLLFDVQECNMLFISKGHNGIPLFSYKNCKSLLIINHQYFYFLCFQLWENFSFNITEFNLL